jgi:hypothetical protein
VPLTLGFTLALGLAILGLTLVGNLTASMAPGGATTALGDERGVAPALDPADRGSNSNTDPTGSTCDTARDEWPPEPRARLGARKIAVDRADGSLEAACVSCVGLYASKRRGTTQRPDAQRNAGAIGPSDRILWTIVSSFGDLSRELVAFRHNRPVRRTSAADP